jgi:hypothetical protein
MKLKNAKIKYGLLVIFALTVLFHLTVIAGFIPFQNVWGGRLRSYEEMIKFEVFSIFLNLVFLLVVLLKSNFLKLKISEKTLAGALWVMAILFALNTLGNLFAVNNLEKYIATPITAILSILCFILAREKS